MNRKVNNMQKLTASLADAYDGLTNGKITEAKAKEISNIAGKIIGSCKTQLEYNKYMKIKRQIPFMSMNNK